MKMEELRNASQSVKRLNPAVFGMAGLSNTKPKQNSVGPNASQVRRQTRRKSGMAGSDSAKPGILVTITSYRRHLLDQDNLQGGAKTLRDEIARSLNLDDADCIICWQYVQFVSLGRLGTLVSIETL